MKGVILVLATIAIVGLGLAVPLSDSVAQPPERQRQLVFGGNVWNGYDVVSTFYPPSVRTIYLLAGATSILTARETLVYFWPIENVYRADWESLNEVVTGTLEVSSGGGRVQRIEQTTYVIQYPDGPEGRPMLYVGGEALDRYRAFQVARDAYNEALRAYYEAEKAYQATLDEARQRQERGEQVLLPEPPQQPEDFTWLSTPPNPGFPLNLSPGDYHVRLLLPSGQVAPGSERTLTVIAPHRFGVTYRLVPEARWTTPERSDDPAQVLYARPGTTVYLQPMRAMLVNDLAYTRLEDPQSRAGRPDRWRWVDIEPLVGGLLEVTIEGQQVTIPQLPYTVRQLPGAALGYEVIDYDPAQRRGPDIVGYRLTVNAAGSFVMRDQAGSPLPGSERAMRPVRPLSDIALGSLVLLPLAVGGWIITARHQRWTAEGRRIRGVAG